MVATVTTARAAFSVLEHKHYVLLPFDSANMRAIYMLPELPLETVETAAQHLQ
jgi:hypothetical protein